MYLLDLRHLCYQFQLIYLWWSVDLCVIRPFLFFKEVQLKQGDFTFCLKLYSSQKHKLSILWSALFSITANSCWLSFKWVINTCWLVCMRVHACVRACVSYQQQSTVLLWRAEERCWAYSTEPHRTRWRQWWGWWGRWSSEQPLPQPKLESDTNKKHTD